MVQFFIKKLTFSNGEELLLEENSLVIFVGANSSGKSTAIKEICSHLNLDSYYSNPSEFKVLTNINPEYSFEIDIWDSWLNSYFISRTEVNGTNKYIVYNRGVYSTGERDLILSERLFSQTNFPKTLAPFVIRILTTENRLQLTRPISRIDLQNSIASHEFHVLQVDDGRLGIINKDLERAFKQQLIIDHGGGTEIGGFIGQEPLRDEKNDRVSLKYRKELIEKNIKLEFEGDGIRSFVACLLAIHCNPHKVILIDEPEMFLHPPQARRLGEILARDASSQQKQIIIATHSSDIIRGALAAQDSNVHICRIERNGNINNFYDLRNQNLRDLWKKPLLSANNTLQGIFHRSVIICEAETDCRFYEKLLQKIEEKKDLAQPLDAHFIHGGGKAELHTLAHAYKKLFIPIVVIADFDILRNRADIEKLLDILGGNNETNTILYHQVSSNLKTISAKVDKKNNAKNKVSEIKDKLDRDENPSSNEIDEVVKFLHDIQEWNEPKKYGLDALSGGAHRDGKQLLDEFARLGLFIVPVGEMEGWQRGLSTNKSNWILEALSQLDNSQDDFKPAIEFMEKIIDYLTSKY